jgi:hypothetical protein
VTYRGCYLGRYGYIEGGLPMTPCSGRLIRAHLIPKQVLKRYGGDPMDPRSFVLACGGITGISAHHGLFDSSLRLRLAREAVPAGVFELADELGILWWVEDKYQPRLATCLD